jgi:hypothetical protein
MNCISKNIIAISMCAILSGCAVDNEKKIYSTDQLLIDEYGLTLKPSKDMYIEFDRISKAYADTMACMGMTAPGPIVEYRSFSFAGVGGAWAFYVPVESTIWINIDEDDMILKRNSRTDIEALEHEFIHHILHKNGASEESRGHSSPLFKKCGLGVKVNN